MNRLVSKNYPEITITVVPGIVSMFTFASKIGVSIGEGAEKISVIPSCYDLGQVKKLAQSSDTMVFLKDGRYFDKVIDLLRESGFPPTSIFAVGQDLDTDHEIVKKLTLGQVNEKTLTTKYFSIMVVKQSLLCRMRSRRSRSYHNKGKKINAKSAYHSILGIVDTAKNSKNVQRKDA